ncbi:MAG: DUF6048 family protein [Bacteroidota bacterium]
MKSRSRQCLRVLQIGLLSAIIGLGLQQPTWATALAAKPKNSRKKPLQKQKTNRQSKSSKTQSQATTPDIAAEPPSKAPRLKKPKRLRAAQPAYEDPLLALDLLVVKQKVALAPYVPFVQAIGGAVDYGRLAMHLWNFRTKKQERWFEGTLNILFIKNIQLIGTFGYNRLAPDKITGNKRLYTVAGTYFRVGLDYWIKYDRRNHLYTGIRYGRSYFDLTPMPKDVTAQASKAAWWELVVGSEYQLFQNWGIYVGVVGRLKGLRSFDEFSQATNYVIPGYGRTISAVVPDATLYIKYQLSFLEKQFKAAAK